MRLKLDENIGRRGLNLLREAGHDVTTVTEQGLGGADDDAIDSLVVRLREFLAVVATRELKNELWIVEPGRVRIHQRDAE